ncbi:hypothetical protein AGLY_005811 [Aphis glycines]|uniref:CLIP domain-containing serine protease n=1 Tax=Aphis glycines TaxID=307491 RepID=A0A6G0TT88_APHGL|nr:hypothetical protein AGLY_005811 [Aphis glycines]
MFIILSDSGVSFTTANQGKYTYKYGKRKVFYYYNTHDWSGKRDDWSGFNQKIPSKTVCESGINNVNRIRIVGENPAELNASKEVTTLMEVQVPITDTAQCKKAYSNTKAAVIDKSVMCWISKGRKGLGDSGGPLMYPEGINQYYLMGIVSYGYTECGELGFSGMYTSLNMTKEKYFIILTFIFGMATAQFNNECNTPNFEKGICVDIKRCPKLLTLLENQRHVPSVLVYLKKSFCGFEGRNTKVCCALENNVTPTKPNVQQQTGNIGLGFKLKIPSETTCGISNVTRIRIIGGNPAELGSWPWIAALGYQSSNKNNRAIQWNCGGTLITNSHVLTAAHCVHNIKNAKMTTVRLGELDLDPEVMDNAMPLDVPVERIIIHEQYNGNKIANDIALVKLKNSVTFNELIQPICMPMSSAMKNIDMSRSLPFVAGWGTTLPTFSYSVPKVTTLMEVQVPITNTEQCKNAYINEPAAVIDDRVLCAGYPEGGKDSCRGDSGGPLMFPKGKQYYLMGIVSFGHKRCGEPGFPGVYTRLPSFMDWVIDKIGKN